jgi:hypothetical protein
MATPLPGSLSKGFQRLPKATTRLRQGYGGLLSDSQKNNLFFPKNPIIAYIWLY